MSRTLAGLVADGATVVKYGEVKDALARKGVAPDFTCPQDGVAYIHRRHDDGEDAYFVAWQGATGATVRCSFRQTGRVPELWNPETGEIADAQEWRMRDGRTDVTLDFDPSGSVFVVFRRPAGDAKEASRRMRQETVCEQPLTSGWNLSFPSGWDAPGSMDLDRLVSWTDLPDDGAKYFSGTATYRKSIEVDPLPSANSQQPSATRIILDLGEVREFAEVTVNGVSHPVLWKPPFRVDITDAVLPNGKARSPNAPVEIAVKVTNLWPNRLIGDERLPPDCEWRPGRNWLKEMPGWVKRGERSPTGRHTFTTWHHWTKDDKLLPSGLLGPVVLRQVRLADANDAERKVK